jgi:hypothetical protein
VSAFYSNTEHYDLYEQIQCIFDLWSSEKELAYVSTVSDPLPLTEKTQSASAIETRLDLLSSQTLSTLVYMNKYCRFHLWSSE